MTLALLASLVHFAPLVSTKRRSLGPIQGLEELSWVTRCYLAWLFFFFAIEDEPYEFERVPFIVKSFQRKRNTTYHSNQHEVDGRVTKKSFRQQYRIKIRDMVAKVLAGTAQRYMQMKIWWHKNGSFSTNIQEGIQWSKYLDAQNRNTTWHLVAEILGR